MQKGFILLTLAFLCSFSVVQAQELAVNTSYEAPVEAAPQLISWESKIHDFGDIPQGVPVVAEFVLTNNSDQPLVIIKSKGSCGCTVAKHDEKPVPPGGSTTITATYNAAKTGSFTKKVSVTTSISDQPQILKVKGEVIAADK